MNAQHEHAIVTAAKSRPEHKGAPRNNETILRNLYSIAVSFLETGDAPVDRLTETQASLLRLGDDNPAVLVVHPVSAWFIVLTGERRIILGSLNAIETKHGSQSALMNLPLAQ